MTAACCAVYAETCGRDHDPDCPTQQLRPAHYAACLMFALWLLTVLAVTM